MNVEQHGKASEIKALTSLRGIAALAVVTQHFSATAQLHSSGWIPSIVPHGYLAVDFFFVLSGFIMSYTYFPQFEADGINAFIPFFLKRIARISPLGLATLAVILLLGSIASIWGRSDLFLDEAVVHSGLTRAILINVLHLQGLFPEYNLNGPSWSISVEMAAYLLFPVLIYIVFHSPRLIALIYFIAGTSVIVGVAISQPRFGLAVWSVPFNLVRCFTEFGYGMLAYRLFRTQGRARPIGSDAWTCGITAFSVAALILRLDLLAVLSFPLVVLAWAWNNGSASRFMSHRVPYFFGTISFSIYLVHHMFRLPELELLQYFRPAPVSPFLALAFALAGSVSVIPAAVLAYRCVERPGRTAMNNFFAKAVRIGQGVGATASIGRVDQRRSSR